MIPVPFLTVFNSDQIISLKCKYFGFVLVIAPQSQKQIKNNIVGSLLFLKFYVQVRMIYFLMYIQYRKFIYAILH